MKISLEWLKEIIDIHLSPSEISEKLAQLGFPVESITKIGTDINGVVSVRIESISKHPNADRLQIATVTDGKVQKTIVCGAPNIAVGQVVPLATIGTQLPGGIKIEKSTIRGVESEGMLCSERELGISQNHGGILQLDTSSKLGVPVGEILGGQDVILDVEITPNRPDLMSHRGIARELALLTPSKLKKSIKAPKTELKTKLRCPIQIHASKECPAYYGRILSNITVQSSPPWMVRRLQNCGIRSINNVVDITNYVLLEWGHPLHAFDLNLLHGPEIHVRFAKNEESIFALDGKTYKFSDQDLVISDKDKPVAIAGIMGGQETAVNQSTREIFLESGVFNSSSVRATSKKLALRSESSLRFEKGTDLETAYIASLRAVELLKELAGAEEESFGEKITLKSKPIKISLDSNSLDKLVGLSVPKNKVGEILKNLNLSPKTKSTGWNCLIPSYRKDLLEERDLMEEFIRVVGYDKIPNRITVGQPNPVPKQFLKKKTGDLEDILKGLGVHQTLTSTFMAQNITEPFVSSRELVPLANPLSQEESFMRPLLLPALLKAVQLNLHHQRLSARFFEIGNVFRKTETNFQEESHMGLVLFGSSRPESWQSKPAPLDIYELKGIFDLLNSHWDFPFKLAEREIKNYLHPHQSFQILYRNQEIGMMGMLHPSLMRLFDLPAPPAVMELNLGDWLEARKIRPMTPIKKYPFVERDIAVVIDRTQNWNDIKTTAERSVPNLLVDILPFDIFMGESLGSSKKSVAFRIKLQNNDHTLTDNEINSAVDKIKTALQSTCGAQVR